MRELKVKLGYSPLSDTIYIYRHGKDPQLALEKKPAMSDFLFALVNWMLHDMPDGSKTVFMSDGKHYELILKPITEIVYPMLKNPYCLGVNADGQPKHPLYIAYDVPMVRYECKYVEVNK